MVARYRYSAKPHKPTPPDPELIAARLRELGCLPRQIDVHIAALRKREGSKRRLETKTPPVIHYIRPRKWG